MRVGVHDFARLKILLSVQPNIYI